MAASGTPLLHIQISSAQITISLLRLAQEPEDNLDSASIVAVE
jgi:hypothetical protein